MAQLLSLTPSTLVVAGTGATNLTTALTPLGSNTGVLFVNNGRRVLAVQLGTTATTATSQIGVTVQAQPVTGVSSGALTISAISILGPWPIAFDRTDGSFDVEIDFSQSNSVSVALLEIPGVV
jgi:hypothetical protein